MSPRSATVFAAFLILTLLLDVSSTGTESICNPRSCAALDLTLLKACVGSSNVTWRNESLAIETIPFGTLESDWTRLLLLLKDHQPKDTLLRDYLLRLSRLMLIAYFDTDLTDTWDPRSSTHEPNEAESRTIPAPGSQDHRTSEATLGPTARKEITGLPSDPSDIGHDNATESSSGSTGQDSKTTANETSGSDGPPSPGSDQRDNIQSDGAAISPSPDSSEFFDSPSTENPFGEANASGDNSGAGREVNTDDPLNSTRSAEELFFGESNETSVAGQVASPLSTSSDPVDSSPEDLTAGTLAPLMGRGQGAEDGARRKGSRDNGDEGLPKSTSNDPGTSSSTSADGHPAPAAEHRVR
ncbi:dentin matrix acidic phosphoprotein 1-like [Copidosoma floridanum]|uniref:dentin matrix acidic phosphoprotein 1-like n=1 Tax=Copidosoma floridanum TaxID=29053 RepID=UPI0006C95CCB|nr:dentin matrix acidic phosphoprotein 1-like [Copidosoma floridanum]